ncbi:MAG: uncharacterized protein A8A55_3351, partial [Amphiamblys sp. WSBS2006]
VQRRIHMLLFADDIALLAETQEKLQEMTTGIGEWATEWDMQINAKKCAAILGEGRASLKIDGEEIPTVKSFRYLGIKIGESQEDVAEERGQLVDENPGKNTPKPPYSIEAQVAGHKGRAPVEDHVRNGGYRDDHPSHKRKTESVEPGPGTDSGQGVSLKALSNELAIPSAK